MSPPCSRVINPRCQAGLSRRSWRLQLKYANCSFPGTRKSGRPSIVLCSRCRHSEPVCRSRCRRLAGPMTGTQLGILPSEGEPRYAPRRNQLTPGRLFYEWNRYFRIPSAALVEPVLGGGRREASGEGVVDAWRLTILLAIARPFSIRSRRDWLTGTAIPPAPLPVLPGRRACKIPQAKPGPRSPCSSREAA
jgi:hypothetical protein